MSKITASRAGKRTRMSVCTTTATAKGQGTKSKSYADLAARWLRTYDPVQLALPLGTVPADWGAPRLFSTGKYHYDKTTTAYRNKRFIDSGRSTPDE